MQQDECFSIPLRKEEKKKEEKGRKRKKGEKGSKKKKGRKRKKWVPEKYKCVCARY